MTDRIEGIREQQKNLFEIEAREYDRVRGMYCRDCVCFYGPECVHFEHSVLIEQKEYLLSEIDRLKAELERAKEERNNPLRYPNNRVACVNCKEPVTVTALNAIKCDKCKKVLSAPPGKE